MITKILLFTALALLCGCSKPVRSVTLFHSTIFCDVTEWEHGFKTKNVTATRYTNPDMGYSIGFKYPGHENNCDRTELCDYIKAHGGVVYSCGGYPGAEMFATFTGVTDKATANAKLKEILPGLDLVVESL